MAQTPEACSRCGGFLFPPHLAPELEIQVAADFVCPNCGRAYLWSGTPRKLSVVSPRLYDEDDEPAGRCGLGVSAALEDDSTAVRGLSLVSRRS
jgi:predicted RNA-binding Zn-ribbon protein involved in translation (DUF1610 family)